MRGDDAALLDILNSARLAVEFVRGFNKAAFVGDARTHSAVLHQLLILGEAVKRLSREFRDAHPELPWRMMAGMRDNLVHEYDSVDLDEVWKTIQDDLPAVISKLNSFIPGGNV